MVTPRVQTDEAQESRQIAGRDANRAVDALLPTARVLLPMVPEASLRAMLIAAQESNRAQFDDSLRTSAPTVNKDQAYSTVRTWFEWFSRGVTVTAQHAAFAWGGNRPEAERAGREARAVADEGRRMGISNAPVIVLGQMRTAIETRGRELRRSNDEIRTQQEDLARAAIGYGFAVSDVLNVFGDFAASGTNTMSRQRSETFRQVLGEAASKRTEELMKRMRELQESMGGAEGARRRQLQEDYNSMLAEYGRLTGHTLASTVADRWIRGGEAPQAHRDGRPVTITLDDMRRAALTETALLIDLHDHNLANVVPVPIERRVA